MGLLRTESTRTTEDCDDVTEMLSTLGDTPRLLQASFEAVSDGLCLLDRQGRVLQCNRAMARIYGQAPEEIIGRPCYRVFHGASERVEGCPFARMLETRHRQSLMLPVEERIFMVVVDPVLDESGELLGGIHIMTDITKRRRAENALRQSEAELRLLSARLLAAQEEERKRIARELHDGLGQSLSAIKFSLEAALAGDDGALASAALLQPLIPMIQGTIDEVRRIGRNLHPSILDDLGILPTITWLCREFEGVYASMQIRTRIDVTEEEIPAALKTPIYRILQEGLHNVTKHSQATRIELGLCVERTTLELRLKDNGRGFRPDEVLAGKRTDRGLGLSSMKERAQLSGGAFSVISAPRRGTVLRATWKLANAGKTADPGGGAAAVGPQDRRARGKTP